MNVLLLVMAVMLVTTVAFAAKKRATKFVLAKTEGTVTITDSAKEEREISKGMQLHNGDTQKTAAESYAWITLDDSKAIKLDENSETYIKKRWGKLEVFTVTGEIWFNVTVPVAKDEAYNIRTSTMVTGIRGTCGWVGVSDDWKSTVYLLTGELECLVVNPLDNGSKTITLKPGQMAEFYVFPKSEINKEEVSCGVTTKTFTKEDIPGFVLAEILGDTELIEKIYKESKIDLRDLTEEYVKQRIADDQEKHAKEIKEIKEKASDEINFVEKEPVWKPDNGDAPSAVAYMIMPQTAQTVQDYLNTEKYRKVVLLPGEGSEDDNTLKVDIALKTPAGKILDANPGVQVNVLKGNSFTV
ncbi:MAG: FecR domain-containing protein, partial [Lachnospiraceae bacterium]|nr:FecR domain-containing protein [Lachnospiraceae bacterium]